MAASRLLTLLGPSVLRSSRSYPQAPSLNFNRICLTPSLRLERYSSSALKLNSGSSTLNGDTSRAVPAHPWPEWVNFIERLKAKGYLTQNGAVPDRGSGGGTDGEGLIDYTEMKLVKDACLSFARDRFDIFNSLSTQDIQIIVEKGCPDLFRKAVNSAKRLRAYLDLDEGDVCSSCSLRGSCDRAYVILSDSEAVAPRTVDVVRILLLYALDPVVISGENNNPSSPGRHVLESSVKKLLSQLIELGETHPDPNLPKPASVTSQRKKQPNDLPVNKSSKYVEMKGGDWVCTKCNFLNFARNTQCRECKAEVAKSVPVDETKMKKGDWNCPSCSFMNFANKRQCFRCQAPRPQRQLKPGDWECPDCDFVNFSRNAICRKCNHERPQEYAVGQGTWKKPY